MSNWKETNEWEAKWWGNCVNTFLEEEKQFLYAEKMGMEKLIAGKAFFNLHGKSVLDIGGGAVSLLLKCIEGKNLTVLDPLPIPQWVKDRYQAANIVYKQVPAEEKFTVTPIFDEVWIYNVLQHVENPKKVIDNARRYGRIIRIFEWINTPPHEGHPNTLLEAKLNKWLGGYGKIEDMSKDTSISYNKAYYGVFLTPLYEKS